MESESDRIVIGEAEFGLDGAFGYVLKEEGAETLMQAILAVASGGKYLFPLLSERAIECYLENAKAARLDVFDTLTDRECEVFQLALKATRACKEQADCLWGDERWMLTAQGL